MSCFYSTWGEPLGYLQSTVVSPSSVGRLVLALKLMAFLPERWSWLFRDRFWAFAVSRVMPRLSEIGYRLWRPPGKSLQGKMSWNLEKLVRAIISYFKYTLITPLFVIYGHLSTRVSVFLLVCTTASNKIIKCRFKTFYL